MSKMKEVAALLGVEIGENFLVYESSCVYRITDSRMEAKGMNGEWGDTTGHTLYDLLKGKLYIIKKPWKPKDGEEYWCATYCGASPCKWEGGMSSLAHYAIGNCFRTEEEAEAHKEEVLARLEKIYADGKPLIGADEWRDKE